MPLPEGYILRHPTEADLPAAQAVLDAARPRTLASRDAMRTTLAMEWRRPAGVIPEADWWVAVGAGRLRRGVAWVWPETAGEVTADHYVHPEHRGLGLG